MIDDISVLIIEFESPPGVNPDQPISDRRTIKMQSMIEIPGNTANKIITGDRSDGIRGSQISAKEVKKREDEF